MPYPGIEPSSKADTLNFKAKAHAQSRFLIDLYLLLAALFFDDEQSILFELQFSYFAYVHFRKMVEK